eukprot:TRINITY_DN3792_c0_g2_i1.p1 TRINITY_DN3792_c0_g2~~TRINITY_DN3792_c0_g2_i1.p1  ORF type:complete len:365 (-),score=36.08 TRINITY_DN3792_c0_g2_i1:1146-2240(-)
MPDRVRHLWVDTEKGDSEDSDSNDDSRLGEEHVNVELTHVSLGQHIYDVAVCFIIRDYVHLLTGRTFNWYTRLFRLVYLMFTALCCFAFQFYLLLAIYQLLCSQAVRRIRKDYSEYQLAVYGADHVHKNGNGFYRGTGDEFFNLKGFTDLPESAKHDLCEIPLSHPQYTFAIILVWSLTCVVDVRKTVSQARSLLILTPTVTDPHDVFDFDEENPAESALGLIHGLTTGMKALLTVLVLVPRFVAVVFLLFLGCRWLLATNSLSEIFLNALALEFMLALKYLLYEVVISPRTKTVAEGTKILSDPVGQFSVFSIAGSSLWALAAIMWVWVYMYHLQQVLPGYRWDVKKACETWEGAVHVHFWNN